MLRKKKQSPETLTYQGFQGFLSGRGFKDLNLPFKNIVALLAWSASHCSLFFHLSALPFPATGSGKTLRPGTLRVPRFQNHLHKRKRKKEP